MVVVGILEVAGVGLLVVVVGAKVVVIVVGVAVVGATVLLVVGYDVVEGPAVDVGATVVVVVVGIEVVVVVVVGATVVVVVVVVGSAVVVVVVGKEVVVVVVGIAVVGATVVVVVGVMVVEGVAVVVDVAVVVVVGAPVVVGAAVVGVVVVVGVAVVVGLAVVVVGVTVVVGVSVVGGTVVVGAVVLVGTGVVVGVVVLVGVSVVVGEEVLEGVGVAVVVAVSVVVGATVVVTAGVDIGAGVGVVKLVLRANIAVCVSDMETDTLYPKAMLSNLIGIGTSEIWPIPNLPCVFLPHPNAAYKLGYEVDLATTITLSEHDIDCATYPAKLLMLTVTGRSCGATIPFPFPFSLPSPHDTTVPSFVTAPIVFVPTQTLVIFLPMSTPPVSTIAIGTRRIDVSLESIPRIPPRLLPHVYNLPALSSAAAAIPLANTLTIVLPDNTPSEYTLAGTLVISLNCPLFPNNPFEFTPQL